MNLKKHRETPLSKEQDDAKNLTLDKIKGANKNFYSILNSGDGRVLLSKVEKNSLGNPFLKFANDNKDSGVVSFTPFDKFQNDDVDECRGIELNDCEIDESCTRNRSNATLFVAGAKELDQKLISLGEDYDAIKESLGLNFEVDEAHLVVFKILDSKFVRVPCGKYPSLKCQNACSYDKEDLPLNLCDDKDILKNKYPQVSNTIDNMGLCKPGGMPFKGNGETPGGLREFVVYMGPGTMGEVVWVGPLSEYIDMLHQKQTQQKGIKNPKKLKRRNALTNLSNSLGGANKRRKYKKTKKKRLLKRVKKKSSKKHRTRKKRSKRSSINIK
tara:strand:+ start:2237 stop:3220 length:984 start_codon:yes stop_codon:yes gene_type:complete